MRFSFQLALVVLIGLGCVYAGMGNFLIPEDIYLAFYQIDITNLDPDLRLAIESQTRLLAGMWVAAGIMILAAVGEFESHTLLLRLVILGLALSAVGEMLSIVVLGGDWGGAIFKSVAQIVICGGIEFWRVRMVRRYHANIEHAKLASVESEWIQEADQH